MSPVTHTMGSPPPDRSGPPIASRLVGSAELSHCETYRFWLHRGLAGRSDEDRRIAWVMANPSTANAAASDPTITRIVRFSRAWSFTSLDVVNLSPFRSSKPELAHGHELAPWARRRNLAALEHALSDADLVLAAWGTVGAPFLAADPDLRACLAGRALHVLRLTKDGHPSHPLARGRHGAPHSAEPQPWGPSWA